MKSTYSIPTPHRLEADDHRGQASVTVPMCVHGLVEDQVRRSPDAIAVVFGEQSLTYRELDRRANQLAHLLRAEGVGREVLVGLCVERSLEMIVALLGILKAGGAYVPLDPAYPSDRIRYVLEDSRVPVLLTQRELVPSLPATNAKILILDSSWSLLAGHPATSLETDASANSESTVPNNDLAYVIYTSGSTGKPKGVQLEHGSVVNFLRSMQHEPGMDSRDVLVAVTTLSFDIAGLEMYLPLISGARLVIASREVTQDGRRLAELLQLSQATIMQATPATWRLLMQSGWQGDDSLRIFCGGEALSPELAKELVQRAGEVWNLYGPTETTIWSAVYRVRGTEERSVPIGRPIAQTQLYILDAELQPVPAGQEGELWIGGAGLARGYFERPELTREKFHPDSFSAEKHARMYRTGDLCRQRADGNVEFLGRLDHQVKLNGFRIELGEIETVLEQDGSVGQAVVMARDDKRSASGEKFLAAYIVPAAGQEISRSNLRQRLQQTLPVYMVPSAFVRLDVFPLTPNGKVDRKALPAPQQADFDAGAAYVAPNDRIERRLVALWEEALDIRPVGVESSFFDLGGRSVVAAQLFMKMSREFGRDLPLALLFKAPTIRELTQHLRKKSAAPRYESVIPIQPKGSRPAFFCVHGGLGGTLFLRPLSDALGPDQPLYAFEPEGLDGGVIHRGSIEELARHYVVEMRKLQPHGPYKIGGYCFGGLVAFEMAQQLRAVGETTGLIAMFNAPLRFYRLPEESTGSSQEISGSPPKAGRKGLWTRLVEGVRWRWNPIRRQFRPRLYFETCLTFVRLGLKVPQPLRSRYVGLALLKAERNYVPRFFPGTITLFRGAGLYDADSTMGWKGLAETIEDVEISGGNKQTLRREIMEDSLVLQVADKLTQTLLAKTLLTQTLLAQTFLVRTLNETPIRAASESVH